MFNSLIFTDGGAASARQRAMFHRQLGARYAHRAAAVSISLSNPLKRSVATALSWRNPHLRFFPPKQIDAALAHIGLRYDDLRALLPHFAKMQQVLPPNETLSQVVNLR